jgi:hypothetical protein
MPIGISLVFDARRTSRDIDSVVLEGHGPLMEVVGEIGRERGLPSTWLNEPATMYVSQRNDTGAVPVFDHSALTVMAASADHLLAMKLLASRATDADDLRMLLEVLGLRDAHQVQEVLKRVFPDAELSDRARLLLGDVLQTMPSE